MIHNMAVSRESRDGDGHEHVLSRLHRLDNLLRNLEDIRVGNRSTRSSSPSTPSSATTRNSSNFSPRTINDAIVETQHKGTVLDRLSFMEDRLLRVCSQLEQELQDADQKHVVVVDVDDKDHHHKKGLKQLVKSCVKGKSKSKSKSKSNKKQQAPA